MTATIRIGTCSWADETLTKVWYPKGVRSGEARIRHYAERFDTVEANSTYYRLPDAELVGNWAERMRVNVTGIFVSSRNAARQMRKKGAGAIVNIASVNGVRAVTGMAAYCASKAAVISLTQTMASEWAPYGIRVNAILPAQVETPMIAEQVGAERKRREERIPMGRYGKPAEIARAACFLASDEASFITGHPLALDGGYLAFGFRPAVTPQF